MLGLHFVKLCVAWICVGQNYLPEGSLFLNFAEQVVESQANPNFTTKNMVKDAVKRNIMISGFYEQSSISFVLLPFMKASFYLKIQ